MKKRVVFIFLLVSTLSFSVTSCSEDEEVDLCAKLDELALEVAETALTFVENQDVASCQEYDAALLAYLEELDRTDCEDIDQDLVDELTAAYQNLLCD